MAPQSKRSLRKILGTLSNLANTAMHQCVNFTFQTTEHNLYLHHLIIPRQYIANKTSTSTCYTSRNVRIATSGATKENAYGCRYTAEREREELRHQWITEQYGHVICADVIA